MPDFRAVAEPLPVDRPTDRPLDPPDRLGELRASAPVCPMAYPDGHQGWLVTSYEHVRAAFAERRLSSRYELMHYPFPGGAEVVMPPTPPGDITAMDPPEHTYYRKLLAGSFTVRRMRRLGERIAHIAGGHVDAMIAHGPPLDLVAAYAYPIPALVICELLGVPYSDREFFQRVANVNELGVAPEAVVEALDTLQDYVAELIRAKRARPGDDLLSDLTRTDLDDTDLAGIGGLLLGAGLDTTANMLALGTYTLLRHPDQLASLRDNPSRDVDAVEELLRYLTNVHTAVKAATSNFDLGGARIRAGDTVTLSLQSANRDPEQFPSPETLDLQRRPVGHLAFGHGIHQCLGQQLARVELQVALPLLLRRLPGLRLAAPTTDLTWRSGSIYGLYDLPVTWDQG